MTKSIKVIPKKRGRPATGKDPMIGARFDLAAIAAIDAWAAKAGDDVTRSEAVRRLVDLGAMTLAAYQHRIRAISNQRSGAERKLKDAKAVNKLYFEAAQATYPGDFERVQSVIQQLGDANRFSDEPELTKVFFDAVREHIRSLVGLKTGAGKRDAR